MQDLFKKYVNDVYNNDMLMMLAGEVVVDEDLFS